MVEQSNKDQSDTQGRIIPDDLQPAEEDTLLLFDSLSSSFPDENVDAGLLSFAADFAGDSTDESFAQEDDSNVVPLYAHEREISFQKVLPKVFVAASVLVLAAVVVPLHNNTLILPDLPDTASLPVVQDAVSATGLKHNAKPETQLLLESSDTDAENIDSRSAAEAVAEPQLPVDENTDADSSIDTDANTDAAGEVLSATPENLNEDDVVPGTVDSSAAGVVTGVARTTVISTESTVGPSVVQSINVTGAARVQRKIADEKIAEASEINKVQAHAEDAAEQGPVAVVVLPAPEKTAAASEEAVDSTIESVSDTSVEQQSVDQKIANKPTYRRSIHRWKAEILKLSRLGLDRQAKLEYRLFEQEYPNHQIELEKQSDKSSTENEPEVDVTLPELLPER